MGLQGFTRAGTPVVPGTLETYVFLKETVYFRFRAHSPRSQGPPGAPMRPSGAPRGAFRPPRGSVFATGGGPAGVKLRKKTVYQCYAGVKKCLGHTKPVPRRDVDAEGYEKLIK